jgi:hypothetical protein
MSEPVVPLRPLGVGDLFDGAIRIFRQRFRVLFVIAAVALLPSAVIGAAVQLLASRLAERGEMTDLALVFMTVLLSVPVSLAAFDVSLGAQLHMISEGRFGRRATIGQAVREALRHFWPLLGVQLVYGLAVALLFVTVIGIPFAIYFAVAWGFAFHAIMFEGAGVFAALSRSRDLVRGHWWRTVGVTLLFLLLVVIVASLLFAVLGALIAFLAAAQGPAALQSPLYVIASSILNLLSSAITTPLTYCAWVLYYYDLRVRKEGLDLAVRAGELAPAPPLAEG